MGIGVDPSDRHRAFDEANQLGLVLLSDLYRRIARQFGVKRPGPLPNKRRTFVVDSDGQVLGVIASESNMEKHAAEALQTLQSRH